MNNVMVWTAKALLGLLVEDNGQDERSLNLRRALRSWIAQEESLD